MTAAKVRLRVVLFRDGVDMAAAMVEGHPLREVAARMDLGLDARIYVLDKAPATPSWHGFLGAAAADDLPALATQSSGAVMLGSHRGRTWALTFGLGHNYIDEGRTEPRFGLRTTLNLVDPRRLREVGSRVYEDIVVSTSRQASRLGGRDVFQIDDVRDIVRSVVGTPRDDVSFGKTLTGGRALSLTASAEPTDIPALLDDLRDAYEADTYKEEFGFIDAIQPITQPELLERLDAVLVAVVAGTEPGAAYLAPPEPIRWDDVEGFAHHGERVAGGIHPELDLQDYRARVNPDGVSVESLRKHRVRLIAASTGVEYRSWPVYDCLVFETELDGGLYILSEGEWFAVERDFATRITTEVSAIPRADLDLPPARRGEWESTYNARAADEGDLALLDTELFRVGGGQIEVADLVHRDGYIVHVKRKTQSATLSHLFSQGRISGETLKADPDLRAAVAAKLNDGGRAEAELFGEGFRPASLTVVYAVIAPNAAELPGRLPFFSRLNLWQARRSLGPTLDYRVAFVPIAFEAR